ncbi:hypothetical protein [Actinomycetospora sp. NBRC 106378]|uniref:hypothetical protein n=1 Tax=Actinomycetospora sp. NBRC 106378 TaxID=3032208 RepID=UPI00249FB264|nr:hypothetical protein [Actinomycetospora sp. NBRC 106378]GLZ55690.1 hypothetical protein Acsp07_53070 [Actinomycetospora sp. NBRC 106378]
MTPDLDTLRLRALAVAGVARLADHHDGQDDGRHARRDTACALRVHEGHVEIDLVLADGYPVTTTTAVLRAALAPLLGGRKLHVTVVDIDPGR